MPIPKGICWALYCNKIESLPKMPQTVEEKSPYLHFLVRLDKICAMTITGERVSTFAKIVDRLRNKNEEELKLLYIKFFRDDLAKKWEDLTSEMNFGDATDEDIVNAIQKKRHSRKDDL
jgi:hypothetical protein